MKKLIFLLLFMIAGPLTSSSIDRSLAGIIQYSDLKMQPDGLVGKGKICFCKVSDGPFNDLKNCFLIV
ncbi:MAG: hypothetical protein JXQ65_07245 [Candidatus Marinimicrobia bacterium]|nr:hypothetical protein [Candidatus Neomarinimicrobiota bacterium]